VHVNARPTIIQDGQRIFINSAQPTRFGIADMESLAPSDVGEGDSVLQSNHRVIELLVRRLLSMIRLRFANQHLRLPQNATTTQYNEAKRTIIQLQQQVRSA
jgi:hypothetical protein